jgi:hypothetical protein
MGFMDVTDRTEALRDDVDGYYGDVVGVFTQEDTWDVHVFAIYRDEEGLVVAMFDCRKEDRTTLPSDEELGDCIHDGLQDEQRVDSLKAALELVVGINSLESTNDEFTSLLGEAQEAKKLAGMSKYKRKKYLQAKALEESEE